jgi:hypothetical protein
MLKQVVHIVTTLFQWVNANLNSGFASRFHKRQTTESRWCCVTPWTLKYRMLSWKYFLFTLCIVWMNVIYDVSEVGSVFIFRSLGNPLDKFIIITALDHYHVRTIMWWYFLSQNSMYIYQGVERVGRSYLYNCHCAVLRHIITTYVISSIITTVSSLWKGIKSILMAVVRNTMHKFPN